MKTNKISRILIPMDFSENAFLALQHATLMARLFKADLYLLHVIETMEFAYNVYDPLLLNNTNEEMEKFAVDSLLKLAKKTCSEKVCVENGIHVVPLTNKGKVISEIRDTAKNFTIDIIVMGTHGAKGFNEYFIGSNAHKTVNVSPCPVITIHTNARKIGFNNIVMPIDNSFHSRQKVDFTIEIALKYGAKIHILGLINSDDLVEKSKFDIKINAVEKEVANANVPYEVKIVKGKNIAVEAMNYSDKIAADLIVIMTDHESNLTGMFLGGFAKQIVNHSKIPVLSIKPMEGYTESIDITGISNPFNNPE